MPKPHAAQLPIKDAYLLTYSRPSDHRGYFNELYNETVYPDFLRGSIAGDWKQIAVSMTELPNTIRGLHMSPYNKVCSIMSGAIYDVIVDMREDSPTFLKWCGTYLSEANQRQIHIPANCLHGFLCLLPNTRMLYLQGGTYSPSLEKDCYPFDPLLDIHWPMQGDKQTNNVDPPDACIIMSDKDRNAPRVIHHSRFPELAARKLMPRVLIIGASGQVGSALVEEYARAGYVVHGTHSKNAPSIEFLLTTAFDLKLAAQSQDAVDELLGMTCPHLVIISSALTAVDAIEKDDPEQVWEANVHGPSRIAASARKTGAKVVVYSTEYVWDGKRGPYAEGDLVSPLNAYGRSKVDMEESVLAADPTALILRTTIVYGPELQGKNFVYQLCRKAVLGETMVVPMDQISTPTYNRDLAAMTRLLVECKATGIINACGAERMSRYDFAMAVASVLGLNNDFIKSVQTHDLQQVAKRPLSAGMHTDKLMGYIGDVFTPRTVREALVEWKHNQGPHSKPLFSHQVLGKDELRSRM
eukprot:TRINITY_DN104451_c0_g1_i1.p1 TRINITY_DN104451_c0_g1~~TRINITY_DN104451_c0_g1_i1.p1  ORF type:complete len:526 (+),score=65.27 TRINITY_DN104451_c0_g1_i1:151-1728(+)